MLNNTQDLNALLINALFARVLRWVFLALKYQLYRLSEVLVEMLLSLLLMTYATQVLVAIWFGMQVQITVSNTKEMQMQEKTMANGFVLPNLMKMNTFKFSMTLSNQSDTF